MSLCAKTIFIRHVNIYDEITIVNDAIGNFFFSRIIIFHLFVVNDFLWRFNWQTGTTRCTKILFSYYIQGKYASHHTCVSRPEGHLEKLENSIFNGQLKTARFRIASVSMLSNRNKLILGTWIIQNVCIFFLQQGFLIDFISGPVSVGFTSAGAIIIATSQVKDILGIDFTAGKFLQVWRMVFAHIGETKLWDTLLGVVCIIVLLALRVSFVKTNIPLECNNSMKCLCTFFRVKFEMNWLTNEIL